MFCIFKKKKENRVLSLPGLPLLSWSRSNWLFLPKWRCWIMCNSLYVALGIFTPPPFRKRQTFVCNPRTEVHFPCPLKHSVVVLITTWTWVDEPLSPFSEQQKAAASGLFLWLLASWQNYLLFLGMLKWGKNEQLSFFGLLKAPHAPLIRHPAELLQDVVRGGTRLRGSS